MLLLTRACPPRRSCLKSALAANPIFGQVHEDRVSQLVPHLQKQEVRAGEVVIVQGQTGDFFYVVLSGPFDVLLEQVGDTPGQPSHTGPGLGAPAPLPRPSAPPTPHTARRARAPRAARSGGGLPQSSSLAPPLVLERRIAASTSPSEASSSLVSCACEYLPREESAAQPRCRRRRAGAWRRGAWGRGAGACRGSLARSSSTLSAVDSSVRVIAVTCTA